MSFVFIAKLLELKTQAKRRFHNLQSLLLPRRR